MPVIPAPGRLRQKDQKDRHEFKASLNYKERPCFKTKTKNQNKQNSSQNKTKKLAQA